MAFGVGSRPFSAATFVAVALAGSLLAARQPPRQAIKIGVPAGAIPRGRLVTITYDLGQPASVSVEILSAGGDVIRKLPTGLPALRGAVVWDTRFAGPEPLEEIEPGPLAPPGSYLVRVVAPGEQMVEVLQVGPAEGAIAGSAEGYAAQLHLALEVRELQTRANRALRSSRQEQKRLADWAVPGRELDAAKSEDLLLGEKGRRGQPPAERSLNGRLRALAGEVDRLNGRPPDALLERFAALQKEANELLPAGPTPAVDAPEGVSLAVAAASGSGPQAGISFDAKGADFGPWLRRFIAQVRGNWMIPLAAMSEKGHVVIAFDVHKNGNITGIRVEEAAAIESFNTSARRAIASSNPTGTLPAEYPEQTCHFTITFYYNETPRLE